MNEVNNLITQLKESASNLYQNENYETSYLLDNAAKTIEGLDKDIAELDKTAYIDYEKLQRRYNELQKEYDEFKSYALNEDLMNKVKAMINRLRDGSNYFHQNQQYNLADLLRESAKMIEEIGKDLEELKEKYDELKGHVKK